MDVFHQYCTSWADKQQVYTENHLDLISYAFMHKDLMKPDQHPCGKSLYKKFFKFVIDYNIHNIF